MSKKEANLDPTHVFKLITGVECEVKEFTGKHQRLLSEAGKGNSQMVKVLADVVVRIGSNVDVTEEDIEKMLSGDRKKLLVEVRQFSLDFPKEFQFEFEYKDVDGQKQTESMVCSLELPERKYRTIEPDGSYKEVNCTEYSEVPRNVLTTLPRSGAKVRMHWLDGKGENALTKIKEEDLNINTLVDARRPEELVTKQGSNGEIPVRVDLDRLKIQDAGHLRGLVDKTEGDVDTLIEFPNPKYYPGSAVDKDIKIDLLAVPDFLFPSVVE